MEVENPDDELVSFANEMGMFYEDLGLPRAWGRVLGWLLVCDPESQSAEDFASVLQTTPAFCSARRLRTCISGRTRSCRAV